MAGKMPVSALQELMAARGHSLPVYIEESFGVQFKCTVQVEGIKVVGYGTTKKAAKHDSAKNALKKLQSSEFQRVVEIPSIIEKPMKNYVGTLNEYSSQHGRMYPEYQFVTTTVNGQYIFDCSFLGNRVQGIGLNKKDAKQDAAKNMLKLIGSGTCTINASDYMQRKRDLETQNTDVVIEMFHKLSTVTQELRTCKNDRLEGFESASSITIVNEDNVEELRNQLMKYRIEFTVDDFQLNPHIVCLKIKNSNLTFLATGSSREDALKKVFKNVLAVKSTGCSLNADLTSFF